jgi:hypothetical protein
MTSSDAQPGQGPERDLRAELGNVESERAELLRQARELRAQLRDEGPMDSADRSAIITQAEQLDAVAADLGRRRDALLVKLGESA